MEWPLLELKDLENGKTYFFIRKNIPPVETFLPTSQSYSDAEFKQMKNQLVTGTVSKAGDEVYITDIIDVLDPVTPDGQPKYVSKSFLKYDPRIFLQIFKSDPRTIEWPKIETIPSAPPPEREYDDVSVLSPVVNQVSRRSGGRKRKRKRTRRRNSRR